MDVHEIILSRGDIRGTDEAAMQYIMDVCNCGYIHRACHPFAEGGAGKIRGIQYLIFWEGYARVLKWLTDAPIEQKAEPMRLLKIAFEDMTSERIGL